MQITRDLADTLAEPEAKVPLFERSRWMIFLFSLHPKGFMMATSTANRRISQVIGSTFDAEFEEKHLPVIYNALKAEGEVKGVKIKLTGEAWRHLGGNRVRQGVGRPTA